MKNNNQAYKTDIISRTTLRLTENVSFIKNKEGGH